MSRLIVVIDLAPEDEQADMADLALDVCGDLFAWTVLDVSLDRDPPRVVPKGNLNP